MRLEDFAASFINLTITDQFRETCESGHQPGATCSNIAFVNQQLKMRITRSLCLRNLTLSEFDTSVIQVLELFNWRKRTKVINCLLQEPREWGGVCCFLVWLDMISYVIKEKRCFKLILNTSYTTNNLRSAAVIASRERRDRNRECGSEIGHILSRARGRLICPDFATWYSCIGVVRGLYCWLRTSVDGRYSGDRGEIELACLSIQSFADLCLTWLEATVTWVISVINIPSHPWVYARPAIDTETCQRHRLRTTIHDGEASIQDHFAKATIQESRVAV